MSIEKKLASYPNGPYGVTLLSEFFQVAPRTIHKWIDTGMLKGFIVPGTNRRRATHEAVLQFYTEYPNIPRHQHFVANAGAI